MPAHPFAGGWLYFLPEVDAYLRDALVAEDSRQRLSTFVRSYYVIAPDAQAALAMVEADLDKEGASMAAPDRCHAQRVERFPRGLRIIPDESADRGVVWKSGRAFFQAD